MKDSKFVKLATIGIGIDNAIKEISIQASNASNSIDEFAVRVGPIWNDCVVNIEKNTPKNKPWWRQGKKY